MNSIFQEEVKWMDKAQLAKSNIAKSESQPNIKIYQADKLKKLKTPDLKY